MHLRRRSLFASVLIGLEGSRVSKCVGFDNRILTIDELLLPAAVPTLAELHSGLILVLWY